MKSRLAAISIALPVFAGGCANLARTETVVLGGGEKVFWRAGEAVPSVPAAANTNGWYSLSADDMNALLNY